MAQKITTIPLFKSKTSGASGTAGTNISDPVDLREISAVGDLSVSYAITGSGTAGSTVWSYLGCPVFDGTYVPAGTFGTMGDTSMSQAAFVKISSPPVMPFMKIKVISGTSNAAVLTAELHVR